MQSLKTQIQQSFQKAKSTYEKNANIQCLMQKTLFELVQKHCATQKSNNVLELGCGNGLLCQRFAQDFDFESYLAVDLVDFSQEFATIKTNPKSKIVFLQMDFEDLTQIKKINPVLKYDLILSNAAIQWVHQPSFLSSLSTLLNPKGFLAFSTFGKENYQELRSFFGIGLEYLDIEDYQRILEIDFKIVESFAVEMPLCFQNTLALFKHLQNTGVNSLQRGFKLNKSHLREYAMRFHNTLTYHPLYVVAQKRES